MYEKNKKTHTNIMHYILNISCIKIVVLCFLSFIHLYFKISFIHDFLRLLAKFKFPFYNTIKFQ
uniref:Bm114 n=1 Tax=Brugia malayi TaxID=6279 RepID=A0A1U7F2D9_BRUMA|nr:Bm114 [Brugia malayi]CDP91804.1 Bm211 [Brugia malayi]CDQ01420.1 Bm767 [Brugia malayi]CDQ01573.1 Bm916 [Brugia malayi]CDQ01577.1 Bm920 [Brugia malayi]